MQTHANPHKPTQSHAKPCKYTQTHANPRKSIANTRNRTQMHKNPRKPMLMLLFICITKNFPSSNSYFRIFVIHSVFWDSFELHLLMGHPIQTQNYFIIWGFSIFLLPLGRITTSPSEQYGPKGDCGYAPLLVPGSI